MVILFLERFEAMMPSRVVWWIGGYLSVFAGTAGLGPGPDQGRAHEILRRADESRGNLDGVEWTVDIDAIEQGKRHLRTLSVQARGYDFLAEFVEPPKTRGQKVLFVQHNMWFAKRDVNKPVPISPKQKLVGGAAYGDIAATNYADDYAATLLPDEVLGEESCYAFELKAVAKNATYERIKYWISRDRGVAVKAEYYTVSGKLFKHAIFEFDHRVGIDGESRPFISKMTISDALNEGQSTTLQFSDPTITELPDSIFNVNLLTTR
jgi:outer membrane lipoprotein-sorting protein